MPHPNAPAAPGSTRAYLRRHKRFGIILAGIVALNLAYGFDPRFTLINLLWIFISIVKTDQP